MSRDTSADTTLDNANMGTREDFEKWAAEEGRSIKRSNPDYAPKPYASAATNNALDGWEARQSEIDALKAENERLRKDAERYQWLRKQHWNEADFAVVRFPKESVRLGTDCPSLLRLDEAIDASINDFSTTTKEERRGSEET